MTLQYLMAVMFAKISILLFYKRLFGVHRHFRLALYGTMVFVVGYCGGASLAVLFKCSPMSATWSADREKWGNANCLSLTIIHSVIGGFNVASDLFILLLPFPILWRLQMPLPKKLGTSAVIATGIL